MDYRRATLSSQIVSGQVSRNESLEILKELPYRPDRITDDKQYLAKKFKISTLELDRLLSMPPKNYKDFPNNSSLIRKFYGFYRRYFSNS